MANALDYFGDPETKETEILLRHFDRFFDCLNVRSMAEAGQKRKDYLKPYTSVDDERLAVSVMIHTFSMYKLCICTYTVAREIFSEVSG